MPVALVLSAALAAVPVTGRGWPKRPVAPEEAMRWRGVGALRVARRPSCTAFPIPQSEAITAPHCVVGRATDKPVRPDLLVLAQRETSYVAWRKASEAVYLPGIVSPIPVDGPESLSEDPVLPALDPPVTPDGALRLQLENRPDPVGTSVDIVGCARDGAKTATIRARCRGVGVTGVACEVIIGLSGSPVLLDTSQDAPPRLVASTSSRAEGAAFVVSIAPRLAELRALITR